MMDHQSFPLSASGGIAARVAVGMSPEARTAHNFQRLCEEATEVGMSAGWIAEAVPTYEAIARLFTASEMVAFWQRQLRLERERAESVPGPGCTFSDGVDDDG
ncbi:hypothetical protein [Haematobacter genomosp. 1]|uniref:Uncharacterized protein n=1 Tax=Haematobacter genomosp. 1 TaxID=366618 RepID=A0A212A6R2_9RHOB|nr:hypothetical protein [Haematobacter genomosp. 1]OWJ74611.1 hypothetical protein CDV49_19030 [Haematobacter genomosp. 1]